MVYHGILQEGDAVTGIDNSPANLHVVIAIRQIFVETSHAYERGPPEAHVAAGEIKEGVGAFL